MVATLPLTLADAPAADRTGANVTRPPATGSPNALETVAVTGAAKVVPTYVDWPPPTLAATLKPRLWKAPMSTWPGRATPRWSVVTPATTAPAPRAGLPGSSAMVRVGPP